MLGNPLQRESNRGRRGGPYQEHSIDAIQAFIKSLGKSEISPYHINVRRQTSRVRVTGERADLQARGRQLRENLATDVACRSNDEDTIHARHLTGGGPIEVKGTAGAMMTGSPSQDLWHAAGLLNIHADTRSVAAKRPT